MRSGAIRAHAGDEEVMSKGYYLGAARRCAERVEVWYSDGQSVDEDGKDQDGNNKVPDV